MNERIRELELQAMSIVLNSNDPDGDVDKMYIPTEFTKKFAELIVRECVGVVEGGSFLHDQAPTAIFARECSVAIKRHFEVE